MRRQTTPEVKVVSKMDMHASFDRNQIKYLKRMNEIFEKYSNLSEDDSVAFIEDDTYKKPNGRRARRTEETEENLESSVILNWTFIGERSSESLCEIYDATLLFQNKLLYDNCSEDSFIGGKIYSDLSLLQGGRSTRKMCSTLIHSPARGGECSYNDNERLLSQRYPESSRKQMLVMKPGESKYSKSGFYLSVLYPAPSDKETEAITMYTTTPTLDKTSTWNNISNGMRSLDKSCMLFEGNISISPGKTFLSNKNNKTVISQEESFICNMDKMPLSPTKTFANQQQKKIDEVKFSYCKEYMEQNTKLASSETRRQSIFSVLPMMHSPGNSYSKSNCSMTNETVTLGKTDQSETDIEEIYSSVCKGHMKQSPKLTFPLTRKNSFSDISSTENNISKANCDINNRTVSIMKTPCRGNKTVCPTNTLTITTPMQIARLSYTENSRNSCSAFPVMHSPEVGHFTPNEHFESLYRKLVLDDPCKLKKNLSEAVSTSVNSPESPRHKRSAHHDLSLSLLKRKKSIDETFISPSNTKEKSTLYSKETTFDSPLAHTDVNSVVSSRMSFSCPVSPKLLPQRVNSECTKMYNSPQMGQRTKPSVYKKLCFK